MLPVIVYTNDREHVYMNDTCAPCHVRMTSVIRRTCIRMEHMYVYTKDMYVYTNDKEHLFGGTIYIYVWGSIYFDETTCIHVNV